MNYFDLGSLCKCLGVRVFSYATATELIHVLEMEKYVKSNPWLCLVACGAPIILFDGNLPNWKAHFYAAEALGYFSLGYLNEPDMAPLTKQKKREAGIFALRLLWRLIRAHPQLAIDIAKTDIDRWLARYRKKKAIPPL